MTSEVSTGVMFARARRDDENAIDSASQTQVEPGPPDVVINNTADITDGSDVQEPTAPALAIVDDKTVAPAKTSAVVAGATAWILATLFSL